MAVGQQFIEIGWRFVIGGFDDQPQLLAGLELQPIGSDFHIEFIYLPRDQGLPAGMGMDRLPWFRFFRIQRAL